jgi:glycolate oxidase
MKNNDAISALKSALGNEVLTDEESLFNASFDAMKLSFMPTAVIRPSKAEAVGTVLVIANEYNIPITTRGAGSTLTGSATPVNSGWVLDLTKLNSIKIDAFSKYAFVGAGTITGDIQKLAEEHGLFYAPDPASSSFCTIGGNIACNAGGLRGIKYGVTRDYVVALEGFLPTGEAVSWGLPLRKFTSGYNVRDLWIGSEGTLGVITKAVLRLIKKPAITRTFLADFASDNAALEAAQALLGQGIIPSVFEFLDQLAVKGAQSEMGFKIKTTPGYSILLIELDGHADVVEEDRDVLVRWGKKHTNKFFEANNQEEAEELWHVRRRCSPAMFQFGDSKLNEDIVVPLEKTVELMEFVKNLSKKKDLNIPVFGHVGDGNFHVNIMYNYEDLGMRKHAEEALWMLMEHVVKLGGAITGEHGIGLAKSPFLRLQHNEAEITAMLAIKKALDPKGILNPGKIFTPFHAWEYERVKAKMRWEKK